MARVDELFSAVWLKFGSRALSSNLVVPKAGAAGAAAGAASDLVFCDRILGLVSRSFAAVIRQLPAEMVLDVLLFYLVLRALDTIEDDMEAFKDDEAAKCRHLTAFADSYLGDEAWSLDGVGEGAERELLQRFGAVSRLFNRLPAESREVIRDITRRMGAGMAEQVGRPLRLTPRTPTWSTPGAHLEHTWSTRLGFTPGSHFGSRSAGSPVAPTSASHLGLPPRAHLGPVGCRSGSISGRAPPTWPCTTGTATRSPAWSARG